MFRFPPNFSYFLEPTGEEFEINIHANWLLDFNIWHLGWLGCYNPE